MWREIMSRSLMGLWVIMWKRRNETRNKTKTHTHTLTSLCDILRDYSRQKWLNLQVCMNCPADLSPRTDVNRLHF